MSTDSGEPSGANAGTGHRVHRPELDALRVVAILAVFVVHCAQVFSPLQYWRVQNPERSVWLGQLTLLAWPWVMPLFMLLAGGAAWHSLGKRTDRDYIKERTLRIFVPLVVGSFVLMPPQIWIERLSQGRFDGGLVSFLPRFFMDGLYPEGNLSAGHLWFLAYLYLYALLTLPLLRWLSGPSGKRAGDELARAVETPWRLVLLPVVPLAITQVALRAPFPETLALVNDWANHGILMLSYVYGFLLMTHPSLEAILARAWPKALPLAILATFWISWSVWTSDDPGRLPPDYSFGYTLFWSAFSLAGWTWLLVLLGAAPQFVRGGGGLALRRAAQGVYPFYIIHQTVIVLVAYPVVRSSASMPAKFSVIAVASLLLTISCVEIARHWRVTRVSLGLEVL